MKTAVLRAERHAAVRFVERYGERLTDDLKTRLLREVRRAVRRHRGGTKPPAGAAWGRRQAPQLAAFPVSSFHGDRRRWLVSVDGAQYRIVVDERCWIIVTALPVRG
jgi:hypothetical protein